MRIPNLFGVGGSTCAKRSRYRIDASRLTQYPPYIALRHWRATNMLSFAKAPIRHALSLGFSVGRSLESAIHHGESLQTVPAGTLLVRFGV
jgi:hypothetical protein